VNDHPERTLFSMSAGVLNDPAYKAAPSTAASEIDAAQRRIRAGAKRFPTQAAGRANGR
jgi:hypothetical protein